MTCAVFVAALLSRSVWLPDVIFHPDESTVLWMALDAVRHLEIPDHGLVSSHHVFQPPGLVWATMPWVALGGGRPEVVIVAFAVLNAAAIALLTATVARFWGLVYAAVLGSFLVVGPDAFFSAWIWHPSLYTAAAALMLAAAIRLPKGTAWWAAVLVVVPGLYALIHYSGLVLLGPALALLAVSRRSMRSLAVPVLSGIVLVACAWGPFLSFQTDRDWLEIRTLTQVTDTSNTVGGALDRRYDALVYAVSHLGQSRLGAVYLTGVIWALVLFSFLYAVIRRRWRDPGFFVPTAMLVTGVGTQVALAQGERPDVLLVWLLPLYALAAWAVTQIVELTGIATARRTVAGAVTVVAVVVVATIGTIDLVDSIQDTPNEQRLDEKWRAARADEPVRYDAAQNPNASENRFYLPCDPPYDWGSEIWYLQEVLDPGRGLRAAAAGGAFEARSGPPCVATQALQER